MATAGEVYTSPSVSQELHVLAVDDSFVDRKVIERLLTLSCCKVTAVESGTRALQYLGLDGENSSGDFDALKVNLIMTDYSMPGMTGYELLKKIKESSAFREIPVVIMSSENILARIDRCLEEGAEEYIVKPVKLSDVRRIKEAVINGEGEENGKTKLPKRKQMDDIPPLPSLSTPLSFSPSGACDDASSSQPSSSASSPVSSPKRLPSSPSSPISSPMRLLSSPSSPVSLLMQPPSFPSSSVSLLMQPPSFPSSPLSPSKRPKLHTED